jgi:hypothetical protein
MGLEKRLPGFGQQLPAKCSVFPFLFGAEHYQSLETALANVRYHYLKVGLFCKNVESGLRLEKRK